MRSKLIFSMVSLVVVFVVLVVFAQMRANTFGQIQQPSTVVTQQAAYLEPGSSNAAVNRPSSVNLDSSKGKEIGAVYEAFLSPFQEPDEEENTPKSTPKMFRSTAPSVSRDKRPSRGHGVVRFSKDLSKAYVDVKVDGVNIQDVNMFHIHCGKPDTLGPILVDFSLQGDIQENLKDGIFTIELTNEDIVKTLNSGHGGIGTFLAGCPITPGLPDKVKTIAGMEHIARRSELYFNLHTKGQTYYGEMRGQVHPVK